MSLNFHFTVRFHVEVLFLILIQFILTDAEQSVADFIDWKPYDAKHMKPALREYYKCTMDAKVTVPQRHPNIEDSDEEMDMTNEDTFEIYVRKFSKSEQRTRKHLWLISGGPGSSTSGIERALSVQLPDTTIYIMDNRGLGHSHKLCHHSQSRECQRDPVNCYKSVGYDPKRISIHETAKDYNYISRLILRANGGFDNEFYIYGSSYGATLAYAAFRFDPFLYSGILLEAFMPEFRLNEHNDIRRHVINSCFSSDTCRRALEGRIDRSEAENLMATVMDPDNKNSCKEAMEFLARHNGQRLNSLLNSYIRVAFYKKTGLRSAFIPLLYNVAHCPDLDEFNGLMRQFHTAYQAYCDESKTDSANLLEPTGTRECHCSSPSNTNHFFGGHIRFSEYSYEAGDKINRCMTVGYLNSANWADVCGMVSDYREEYKPYLYEPEVPVVPNRMLERSPTRIVITTGKLDTQTPHDAAQREFDRLPMNEKYMFSADHAGHGTIDSWEVPGLKLDLMLSFLMTGSHNDLNAIHKVLKTHNEQPERIWRSWDRQVFGDRDIWNFDPSHWKYNWKKFGLVIGMSLLVPFTTILIQVILEDDDEESKGKGSKVKTSEETQTDTESISELSNELPDSI